MFFSYVPNLRFENDNSEWKLIKIKTLLKFQNGLNESQEKYGKGTKYISVSDILNNDYIMYDCIKGFVDINIDTFNNFIVEYGDILFQRSSETIEDIGRSNVYLDKVNKSVFGGFIIRGKKIGEYDPIFFKHLLDTPTARKIIIKMGAGAQHYNISQDGLEKISLYFPTLEIQNKIGIVLSKMDLLISTQNKIIEDLDTLKKSISLLIFGDNSEIKLNWKLVKLSNVLKERKTYDIKESKYSHATLSKEGIYAKIDRYNRDFLVKDEEKNYKVTHLNDICYNPANLKFGVICLNTYGDAIFSPIYVTYEVRAGNDPYFISQYITNPTFIGHIRKYEQGTVYERMAVSSEDFLKGEINLPTYQVQLYISKIFKSINDKMNLELQVLEKYKEQKKFLLSNMFI